MLRSVQTRFQRIHWMCLALLALPVLSFSQARIGLVDFATDFQRPVDITNCGDSRLFITEQRGFIWIVDTLGNRLSTPFMDIDAKVNSNGNEQGFLGLAFHPNYAQNGWFYVNYIRTGSTNTRISRFKVSSSNPNVADPATEQIMLDITQPFSNHNGGGMKFGADGMLYISLGDGGSGGDPQNNGQKKSTFLGKMLRVDVNSDVAPYYTIPSDNPFVGNTEFLPEIWAWGLRNPWRFSFDRLTGDMWIGDVGQNKVEEIDFEPADSPGGLNYGWRCYEGNTAYNTSGCQPFSTYEAPIFDYQQGVANGCSVTGGFVYRGSKYPDLYGKYIFTDFCSGRFWTLERVDGTGVVATVMNNFSPQEYSSFGEDNKGELYVAALSSGKILRVIDACANFAITGTVVNATCEGSANGSIAIQTSGSTGAVTYTWNGLPGTATLSNLNPGTYTLRVGDANLCARLDTFVIAAQEAPTASIEIAPNQLPAICDGNTILLQAQPNPFSYAYEWFLDGQLIPGTNGPSLTTGVGGLYTTRMVNGPCKYPLSNTILIDQVPTPEITLAAGTNPLCLDSIATFSATLAPPAAGGFTYQWYNDGIAISGANSPTLTTSIAGNYSVQWLNMTTGCNSPKSDTLQLGLVFPIPPQFVALANVIYADSTYGPVQWFLNGVLLPNTGYTLTMTQSGTYSAAFTYGPGCKIIESVDFVTSTRQPDSIKRLMVTPNPTAGTTLVDLRLVSEQDVRFVVSDVNGRTVLEAKASGAVVNQPLDLSKMPAGTYFLHVHLADGVAVREIVKL